MVLGVGATIPSFSVPGSDGKTWSPETLLGRPYVLTFYPKDETAGCVAQVCALRDVWEDFRGAGILVFGVSRDTIDSHQGFIGNRKIPYTLLSDATGAMHKALDVGRTWGVTNRVSYLVDKEGRVVEAYKSNLRPEAHAAKMLAAARALGTTA